MASAPSSPPGSPPSRYREAVAPAGVADLLACVWRQDVAAAGHAQRVVPDGCVDLIWRAGRELVVAGPATMPVTAELPGGSTTLGVRFRPGAGAAFLGLPLSELRDRDVALEELCAGDGAARGEVGRRLTDSLWSAESAPERLRLLTDAVRTERERRLGAASRAGADAGTRALGADPLVAAAVRRLGGAGPAGDVRIAALGAELGLSERQLLRRFRWAVGYGPKTLARVLRFQRFLAAAWAGGEATLARLALDAGYADQAHLVRECRALAGVAPGQLLRGA